MKSRFIRDGEPSGFGAASETPAPWIRAIAAIAKAPLITPTVRSDSRGSTSGGSPLGIAPTSATVATSVSPITATTTVGTTTAISVANSANLVRLSRNITTNADTPTIADAMSMPDGWVMTYRAFCAATPPSVGEPTRPGS